MPISGYVADFACAELKLIVEVDGTQHAMPDAMAHDGRRTSRLGETGWTVIRFWNCEVIRELDMVCDHIVSLAQELRKGIFDER